MCSRLTLVEVGDWNTLYKYFGVVDRGFRCPPQYNVAPSENVVAVISAAKERRMGFLKWGLVLRGSDTGQSGYNAFNTSVEALQAVPTTRGLLQRNRCVVAADSFFARNRNTRKTHRIRLTKQGVFAFAGLFDTWTAPDGKRKLHSCTILTCPSNWFMRPYGDHMPVILDRAAQDVWLDRSIQDTDTLMKFLRPFKGEMHAYRVTDLVWNVGYDGPECIEEFRWSH